MNFPKMRNAQHQLRKILFFIVGLLFLFPFSSLAKDLPLLSLQSGDFYFSINHKTQFLVGRNANGPAIAQFENTFREMESSGERIARIHLTFAIPQKRAPGVVDKQWLLFWDTVFDKASAHNIYVIPVFGVWVDWNNGSDPVLPWNNWHNNLYNKQLNGITDHPSELFRDSDTQHKYLGWLESLSKHWGTRSNIAAWEVFSEMDLVSRSDEQGALQFYESAAKIIRRNDVHKRAITASLSSLNEWPSFYQSPYLDFIELHPYAYPGNYGGELDAMIIDNVTEMRKKYHKPVMIGESGIDVRGPNTEYSANPKAINTARHALWAALVSGSMTGRMLWWEDGMDKFENGYISQRYSDFTAPFRLLISSLNMQSLQPLDVSIEYPLVGHAVANDQYILLWLRDADMAPLDWNTRLLKKQIVNLGKKPDHCKCEISFYSGIDGKLISVQKYKAKGDQLDISLPDFSDSIIAIIKL